jgi:hypothetical protein
LQHFLLVAAVLLLLRAVQSSSMTWLAAGSFAVGLGLWDKVSFAWMIVGLGVASLIVFPREVWGFLTFKRLSVAVAAVLLGCCPLLIYNYQAPVNTVKGNVTISLVDLPGKATTLRRTVDGSGLFGYMVPDQAPEEFRRANLMGVAVLVVLLATPFWWRTASRKILLFAVVFMVATWVQMASVKGAGGAVHHAVLLWPFPQLLVAVAIAELPRRMGTAIAVVLIGSNLLLTNQYFVQFARNGAAGSWTDGIYALNRDLREYAGAEKQVIDWGMFNSLTLMNGVDPSLHMVTDAVLSRDRSRVAALVSQPKNVFVSHVVAEEQFRGIGATLEGMAAEAGYRKRILHVTRDSHGREIFEVFHFERDLSGNQRAAS